MKINKVMIEYAQEKINKGVPVKTTRIALLHKFSISKTQANNCIKTAKKNIGD